MLRWIKYAVGAVVTVGAAGLLLLGTDFHSYVGTSARAAREAVQDAVPVEFELRRASDMVDDILPDLQAQVRMIAQEEVEVGVLQADIADSQRQLASEQATLTALREKLRTFQASYSVNGRNVDRARLTEQLQQRFERFKQGEFALASKQRLLEKRHDGLNAALALLEKMRHRKIELEQKIEALAAQYRLVQAAKIETGTLIDGSQLSQADQLLKQIETRLAVAERVLAHEQNLVAISETEECVTEDQLLAEIDHYFDEKASPAGNAATVVGLSDQADTDD